MLTITLADLAVDITPNLKGTGIRQVRDIYAVASNAANRMLARLDPEETRRTQTLSTPFYDNVNVYALPTDVKRIIDIRPTANRQDQPGVSDFSGTTPRQFSERLTPNSFSIGWNSMIRTLRAQRLPAGNVVTLDSFESATGNGSWSANVDASGLYTENLNYVEGSAALGFGLSGSTGLANLLNTTAAVADLSALRYNDASMLRFYIPSGFSSRFTSFKLLRGESASAYRESTVTTQADGRAFQDGWNYLLFNWATATATGSPTNLLNTYRRFSMTYSAGAAIPGVLLDAWTDALGNLYEVEYYSEYMFRTAAGVWISKPTLDTDLVNVGPALYEILKAEMMIDITKQIRTGTTMNSELTDWRQMLNGQPPNRYIREPQYRGLYSDYMNKFPSSAIVTTTNTYEFDV